jgi:hypothetical protein
MRKAGPRGPAPPNAEVRPVVQRNGSNSASSDLVRVLQAADLDERIIALNPTGRRGGRVAASAAETFVLVATVCHLVQHGGRTDEIQGF